MPAAKKNSPIIRPAISFLPQQHPEAFDEQQLPSFFSSVIAFSWYYPHLIHL